MILLYRNLKYVDLISIYLDNYCTHINYEYNRAHWIEIFSGVVYERLKKSDSELSTILKKLKSNQYKP